MKLIYPNSQEVAAKVLDGEAVLIHFESGTYYSMSGVAADIWQWLEEGATEDGLAQRVVEAYAVPAARAGSDVQRLLAQLWAERLIVEKEAQAAPASLGKLSSDAAPYVQPELEIHRDMSELLALDPPAPRFQQQPWSG